MGQADHGILDDIEGCSIVAHRISRLFEGLFLDAGKEIGGAAKIVGVADMFPEAVISAQKNFGCDSANCFSGFDAYQKVLEDNKKSEKTKYQEMLDSTVNMVPSVRKVLQEEINSLDGKNEMEASRKIQFLSQLMLLLETWSY